MFGFLLCFWSGLRGFLFGVFPAGGLVSLAGFFRGSRFLAAMAAQGLFQDAGFLFSQKWFALACLFKRAPIAADLLSSASGILQPCSLYTLNPEPFRIRGQHIYICMYVCSAPQDSRAEDSRGRREDS